MVLLFCGTIRTEVTNIQPGLKKSQKAWLLAGLNFRMMGEYLGCIEHGAKKYCTTSAATYQNTFVTKLFSQQATTKNACTLSKCYQNKEWIVLHNYEYKIWIIFQYNYQVTFLTLLPLHWTLGEVKSAWKHYFKPRVWSLTYTKFWLLSCRQSYYLHRSD